MPRLKLRDFGTSLKFVTSGTDKVVTPSLAQLDNWTVAFWAKTSDNQGGVVDVDASGFNNDLLMGVAPDTTGHTDYFWGITIQRASDTSRQTISGNTRVNGQWQHIVGTYDGTTMKLYVNGVLDKSLTASGCHIKASAWTLGVGSQSGRHYVGELDEFLVYSAALSATEVSDLYYNGIVPTTSQLVHYNFNEATGSTATDSSGNGNNGTITGATYSTDVPMKPRLKIRDMGTALLFAGGNDRRVDCGTDWVGTGAVSFSVWVNAFSPGQGSAGRVFDNGKTIISIATIAGSRSYGFRFRSDGVANISNNTSAIAYGVWAHLVITRTSSGVTNFYVNGVLNGTANQNSGTPEAATTNAFIGINGATLGNEWDGLLDEFRTFNRVLTDSEVSDLYYNGTLPGDSTTSQTRAFLFDEGAGSTANDTSGNANHGTITSATFSADVPMKPRSLVGANLVKNGDFEYAPPFTAATTDDDKFIDGTADGSSTNNLFGWAVCAAAIAPGASVRFDPTVSHSGSQSLKLSTNDATGTVVCGTVKNAGTPTSVYEEPIPLLPNTSYTLTAWIKTDNAATDAVWVDFRRYTGAKANLATTSSTKLSGTNDWTKVTITVTTEATARFGAILLRNGVAGNVSDAWFDDVELYPTTNTTRTTASSRTAV